jgi:hypothetical protein
MNNNSIKLAMAPDGVRSGLNTRCERRDYTEFRSRICFTGLDYCSTMYKFALQSHIKSSRKAILSIIE